MKIAVLFDGAGLARLGLERAGHECIGVELNPIKHYLSKFVGTGNCILGDATKFDLSGFDAVWSSPPCQIRSSSRFYDIVDTTYAGDYLRWSLDIPKIYPNIKVLWVENVIDRIYGDNSWGYLYNAAQFLETPIQNRNRIIGGNYISPKVYRLYKHYYKEFNLCPAITATEYQGHANDTRRASRYYGRRLTVYECAYHQGFDIPDKWRYIPKDVQHIYNTPNKWLREIYQGIGNGVPVYMAKSFGDVYK